TPFRHRLEDFVRPERLFEDLYRTQGQKVPTTVAVGEARHETAGHAGVDLPDLDPGGRPVRPRHMYVQQDRLNHVLVPPEQFDGLAAVRRQEGGEVDLRQGDTHQEADVLVVVGHQHNGSGGGSMSAHGMLLPLRSSPTAYRL